MLAMPALASIESSMRAAWISCASSSNLTAPSGMSSATSGSSSMAATFAAAMAGSMCSLVVMLAPRCRGTVLPAIRGARYKLQAETTANHHLVKVLKPHMDVSSATVAEHPHRNMIPHHLHITKLCVLLRTGGLAVLCTSSDLSTACTACNPAGWHPTCNAGCLQAFVGLHMKPICLAASAYL